MIMEELPTTELTKMWNADSLNRCEVKCELNGQNTRDCKTTNEEGNNASDDLKMKCDSELKKDVDSEVILPTPLLLADNSTSSNTMFSNIVDFTYPETPNTANEITSKTHLSASFALSERAQRPNSNPLLISLPMRLDSPARSVSPQVPNRIRSLSGTHRTPKQQYDAVDEKSELESNCSENSDLSDAETVSTDDDEEEEESHMSASAIFIDECDDFDLHLSFTATCGDRHHMEDVCVHAHNYFVNCPTWQNERRPFHYFGIFDGHGGRFAAQFVSNHLLDFITREDGFWQYNDDTKVMQAIYDGFNNCHMDMWHHAKKTWPTLPTGHPSTAGTTASIAILRGKKMYTGHTGDSGIVLSERKLYDDKTNVIPEITRFSAVRLSDDHKPEDEDERERIEDAGGEVRLKSSVHRVVWRRPMLMEYSPLSGEPIFDYHQCSIIPFLAVARSLGDFWSYNEESKLFTVSPTPDVSVVNLDWPRHRGLVIGSDGLWNVLSAEECVGIVGEVSKLREMWLWEVAANYDKLTKENPPDSNKTLNRLLNEANEVNMADCIIHKVMSRCSGKRLRADNVAVFVVSFEPKNIKHVGKSTKSTLPTLELMQNSLVKQNFSLPPDSDEMLKSDLKNLSRNIENPFLTTLVEAVTHFEDKLPEIYNLLEVGYSKHSLTSAPSMMTGAERWRSSFGSSSLHRTFSSKTKWKYNQCGKWNEGALLLWDEEENDATDDSDSDESSTASDNNSVRDDTDLSFNSSSEDDKLIWHIENVEQYGPRHVIRRLLLQIQKSKLTTHHRDLLSNKFTLSQSSGDSSQNGNHVERKSPACGSSLNPTSKILPTSSKRTNQDTASEKPRKKRKISRVVCKVMGVRSFKRNVTRQFPLRKKKRNKNGVYRNKSTSRSVTPISSKDVNLTL